MAPRDGGPGPADGPGFVNGKSYSEATEEAIDAEVRRLLEEAEVEAGRLLRTYRRELDVLATTLLEHETLDEAAIRKATGLFGPVPAEVVPLRAAVALAPWAENSGTAAGKIAGPGMLSNNLAAWPDPGAARARNRRRVALRLLALAALGGFVGVGGYAWIVSADAGGPPVAAVATSSGDVPPADLVVTDLFGNRAESRNWSGYAATAGGYTAVSGAWSIPDLARNSPPGTDAAWVGIGGVHSEDLIQAGTLRTVLGGGNTRQEAWIELLPQGPVTVPLAVNPGDSIHVSISQQAPESWLVEFNNLTSGRSFQATQRYASSLSSVEWVAEAPSSGRGRSLPLDDFGTLRFDHAAAVQDDQMLNIAQSGARAITMITSGGLHLAEPSDLGTDGSSFSVTRTATPSPPPRRRP
ncbi:MAG: G1 family glutamic endopeptidase [Chloroflexota bacterium]